MKVKNIMFSGFAAAILMGVGAANAVVTNDTYNLANKGYVDAKVGQVDAKLAGYATTGQLEGYQQKLSGDNAGDNIAISEVDGVVKIGASNVVKTTDIWDKAASTAAGALDDDPTNYLNAATQIDDKVPTVAAARQIAGAVLTKVDSVSGNIDKLEQIVGGTDENGQKSGLVKAVADNTSAIQTLNGDVNTEGSVAKSIADALDEKNYLTAVPEEYVTSEELAAEKYTTMDAVTAKGYVTAQGAKDAVATEGYLKSGDLTEYAKTAELNAASVGQAGSFIATISETNGIVSASATEFAGEVTANGAIAPTAKAVNDFVTGKGYAVASEVNAELAKKLQLTEGLTAGTYLVTVGETGAVTYTAISVATADDATAQPGA